MSKTDRLMPRRRGFIRSFEVGHLRSRSAHIGGVCPVVGFGVLLDQGVSRRVSLIESGRAQVVRGQVNVSRNVKSPMSPFLAHAGWVQRIKTMLSWHAAAGNPGD